MRRLAALVLACGLVPSSTTALSLHVHDYVGHDHPDHHHGPAAHEHERSALVDRDHHHERGDDHQPAVKAGSCDPGRHAVIIRMHCAYMAHVHLDLAELPGPIVAARAAPVGSATPVTDLRVHGPPFDARIPSRAPPTPPA